MTPEIEALRANETLLSPLFDETELKFVDDPEWRKPSDISYLNERDRANPHIMANVEAMERTNAMISWFGRDREGFLGLWRGPAGTAIERSPVVRFDTEWMYEICARTVADYIALENRDSFEEARDLLREAGLSVLDGYRAVWASVEGMTEPKDLHKAFYTEGCAKRGVAAQ
jgi:hypothetical protein